MAFNSEVISKQNTWPRLSNKLVCGFLLMLRPKAFNFKKGCLQLNDILFCTGPTSAGILSPEIFFWESALSTSFDLFQQHCV